MVSPTMAAAAAIAGHARPLVRYDHDDVGVGCNEGGVVTLAKPDAQLFELRRHRRVDVLVGAADLVAGRYYINIHTAANPGGEIRGQVMPAH